MISALSLRGFDGIQLWFQDELSGSLRLAGCEGETNFQEHPSLIPQKPSVLEQEEKYLSW